MDFLLSFLIFGPLLFAAIALFARNDASAKGICTVGSLLVFLATIPLAWNYSSEESTLRGTFWAQEDALLDRLDDAAARRYVDLAAGILHGRSSGAEGDPGGRWNTAEDVRSLVKERSAIELFPDSADAEARRNALLATIAAIEEDDPDRAATARAKADVAAESGDQAKAERLRHRAEMVLRTSGVWLDEGAEAILISDRTYNDQSLSSLPATPAARQAEISRRQAFVEICELRKAASLDLAKRLKFVTRVPWIKTFGVYYFVGIDGLSLPLIFLSTLLVFLCLVYSWHIEKAPKGYYILFLVLETGLVGVFCALDMFLFYVFWEVVLLPGYFLIGIWGGPRRTYAAIKFFIYTLAGSVLMLLAMLALYFNATPTSFNMLALLHDAPTMSLAFQGWVFAALFIAFAIKVPVFPFHTWLPDAHVQAPTAFSVMLAGVMLKMGGYGFFRLAYPLCPDAALSDSITLPLFDWVLPFGVPALVGGLGLINIIYGALVAMAQTDFKSLVAYSSVSHMGFILLGLASYTHAAFEGAALQMFNHGVSSAMMFFVVGVIYDRAHHRDLNAFGGIGLQMPWYTGVAMIAFFSSLGLPGLNGFIGEVLIFLGAFQSSILPKWMVFTAVLGLLFGSAYILWTIRRVFLGELGNDKYRSFSDLEARETIALVPLAIMCIVIGVYPKVIIDVMDATMVSILEMSSKTFGG